ncbi:MAG: ribosomal protein S18-alanine N-acetyltransferase [Oscillospiraceae bacterium]|nr:ribosomal protein S18-alanine N-acetyltransferase [Oscillospiraceae bacterium]
MKDSIEVVTSEAAGQLAEIEAECFQHPLEKRQIARLLEDGNTCFLAARDGEVLTGSVWVQTVLDEGYIGNVAVRPAYRRRGIADALLEALDRLAGERGLSFLTLEVRSSNRPAVSLYEKHGYARVGLRPAYYSDPREDAVLMSKYWKQEKP